MNLKNVAIAYCLYGAIGEGVTIFVAVGTSKSHAELQFLANVPKHFHPGLTIKLWTESSIELDEVKNLVPKTALELLSRNPPGTTEHFSVTHYNLS
jgi:hypothetical protein